MQKGKTTVEARGFRHADGVTSVAADPMVVSLVATEHAATIAYAQQPLGVATNFQMSAYFALAGDVSATQIVNQAQLAYVKNFLATSTDPAMAVNKTIPLLSSFAPLKAGRNGPSDYTDVAVDASAAAPAGLQVRSPGDLYLYSNNTIHALRIKGSDLKNWLETSARQFAQIDPARTTEQDLVPSFSTVFSFDVTYAENNELRYQIDVRQPIGSRIVGLTYKGQPVQPNADFIVATNDFRATGGGFPLTRRNPARCSDFHARAAPTEPCQQRRSPLLEFCAHVHLWPGGHPLSPRQTRSRPSRRPHTNHQPG